MPAGEVEEEPGQPLGAAVQRVAAVYVRGLLPALGDGVAVGPVGLWPGADVPGELVAVDNGDGPGAIAAGVVRAAALANDEATGADVDNRAP